MDIKKIQNKFSDKAKDSFVTKLNLYLFDKQINNRLGDISIDNFKEFKISDDLVKIYTTKYWKWEVDTPFHSIPSSIDLSKATEMTIKELYKSMKEWKIENSNIIDDLEKDYIKNFKNVFSFDDFKQLLSKNNCHYCDITISEVIELVEKEQLFNKQNYRGFVLEIDRIDSNKEYTKNNCVLSCYWCNNAKTDEFNEEEFKKFGKP